MLVVFWGEFVEMVQGFLADSLSQPVERDSDAGCRLFIWLVVGTLPAVAGSAPERSGRTGVLQYQISGWHPDSHRLNSLLADRASRRTQGRSQTIADSLWVGIGQAAALLPGISRSGTTIACGLARGLSREQAARFSFLLSIPSIFGALVYSLPDLAKGRTPASTGVLLAGMLAAALTGYLAIRMLLAVIRGGRLVWFSYYTWFVGLLVLIFA